MLAPVNYRLGSLFHRWASTLLPLRPSLLRHKYRALRDTRTGLIGRTTSRPIHRESRRHRNDQLSLVIIPACDSSQCRHRHSRTVQRSPGWLAYSPADVSQPRRERKRGKRYQRPAHCLRSRRRRSRCRHAKVSVGAIYVKFSCCCPSDDGRVGVFARIVPPKPLASGPLFTRPLLQCLVA